MHRSSAAVLCAIALLVLTGCTEDQPAEVGSTEAPLSSGSPSEAGQHRLNTRLIAAAWDDDVPRARRLIAAGADVNAEDDSQQSAFLIATSEGHRELLDLTLRHGADVEAKDGFHGTGLIRAAERGHWDVVGRLVQTGTPLDHVNNLGWTALHEAIILGDGGRRSADTVRVLVAAGADVALPSEGDGMTPSAHAAERGYAEMADLLQAAIGVAPRPGSRHADRALLSAARAGNPTTAALALRGGARVEVRDAQGRTPVALATSRGHRAVTRLLTALGATH